MSAEATARITADEINCLVHSYFKDSGFVHSAFALQNEGRLQNSPLFSKHIPRGELVELLSKALLYVEVEAHWRGDAITNNCKNGFSLLEPHVCSVDPSISNAMLESNAAETEQVQRSEPVVAQASLTNSNRSILNSSREKNFGQEHVSTNGVSTSAGMSSVSASTPAPKAATVSATQLPAPTATSTRAAVPASAPAVSLSMQKTEPLPQAGPSTGAADGKRKASPMAVDGPSEKRTRHDPDDMDVDPSSLELGKASSSGGLWQAGTNATAAEQSKKLKVRRPQGPGDDITNPNAITMLSGHQTEVFVCAFNPAKRGVLATGSKDSVVNIWNLPEAPVGQFAPPPGPPISLSGLSKAAQADLTSLNWNSSGTLLSIGSYDGIVRIVTVDGSIYFVNPQHQAPIFASKFSKSGKWMVTASLDTTTCLWNVSEKVLIRQYRCHTDCCLDVEWLDENTFASAGADKQIIVMRIDQEQSIKSFQDHQNEINQLKVNPSGTRLASCSDDNTARVWNVENITGESIPGLSASEHAVVLRGHTHSVSTIDWCPDHAPGTNELLASSSFDGTARIWDSVTGDCLKIFTDHKRPVYALSFSPNGKWLATGSGDGWMYLYDVNTREKKWSWYAGKEKPGVFEFDWQPYQDSYRLALALECRQVAVIDTTKIPYLRAEGSLEKVNKKDTSPTLAKP